jgi:hypothetical protein
MIVAEILRRQTFGGLPGGSTRYSEIGARVTGLSHEERVDTLLFRFPPQ